MTDGTDRAAIHALLATLEHSAARRLLAGFMRAHMRELHGVQLDVPALIERLEGLTKRRAFIDVLLDGEPRS